MRKIDQKVAIALQVVHDHLAQPDDRSTVLKEYDGYAASFAPSVRTAGLIATLSFYTDIHKEERGHTRRFHILQALYRILHPQHTDQVAGDALLNHAIGIKNDARALRRLKQELTDSAVALKLALRNFHQIEG